MMSRLTRAIEYGLIPELNLRPNATLYRVTYKRTFNNLELRHSIYITEPSLFINIDDKLKCGICMETLCKEQFGILECKHMFCTQCIKNQMTNSNKCCALCRQHIDKITVYNDDSIINNE